MRETSSRAVAATRRRRASVERGRTRAHRSVHRGVRPRERMASRVAGVHSVRMTSSAGGRVSVVASRSRVVSRAAVSPRFVRRVDAFDLVVVASTSSMTMGRRARRGERAAATRAAATEDDVDAEPFVWYKDPTRLAIAAAWVSLGSFATFGAPSGTSAFDLELVKTIVGAPFSGAANPLFEALFNSLGIVPATYACLLMPGAKNQKIPAALCVGASFALGFFALGPYLVLREPRTAPTARSELGFVTRNIWESKINAIFLAGFAVFLAFYGFSNLNADTLAAFASLFKDQSMLACVSTCDLVVLSLCVGTAIAEDMTRRNVDPANAFAFASLPVIGPTLWLLTRPPLEE